MMRPGVLAWILVLTTLAGCAARATRPAKVTPPGPPAAAARAEPAPAASSAPAAQAEPTQAAPAAQPEPAPKPAAPAADSRLPALEEQLTRIAGELSELENALARVAATSRQQDDRISVLERRIKEVSERAQPAPPTPPPPGFAPSAAPPEPRPVPSPSGAAAQDLYQTALARLKAGDRDAAMLLFYELIANHPQERLREAAQVHVADIYSAQRDFDAALAELESLLAAVPNGARTAEVLLKIGLTRRALGDEASARRAWERVVRDYPKSEAAREARILLRGGRRG